MAVFSAFPFFRGPFSYILFIIYRLDLVRSASERAEHVDSVCDVSNDQVTAEKAVNDGDDFTGELAYLSYLTEYSPYSAPY